MRALTFSGHSDDVFYVEGTQRGEPDEVGCFDRGVALKVVSGEAGLLVVGHYAPAATDAGAWMIGLSQLDEDIPLPGWDMAWTTAGNCYSPQLTITVPDDTRVSVVQSGEEG